MQARYNNNKTCGAARGARKVWYGASPLSSGKKLLASLLWGLLAAVLVHLAAGLGLVAVLVLLAAGLGLLAAVLVLLAAELTSLLLYLGTRLL